jgi:hypothetical protein
VTRLHAYDPDEGSEMAEAHDGCLPGHDAWKGATPPEYGAPPRLAPLWLDLLPEGSCGRGAWSLCTLPAGHHNDNGTPCNSLQWGGLR